MALDTTPVIICGSGWEGIRKRTKCSTEEDSEPDDRKDCTKDSPGGGSEEDDKRVHLLSRLLTTPPDETFEIRQPLAPLGR